MKKNIWRIFFKLFAIGFVFYISYIMAVQQPIINAKNKEINNIDQKIKNAEILNLELREQLILIDNDEFIEKEAREKLGLIKPGEKIFIDIDE